MVLNEAYDDVLIGPLPPSIMGKYWLSAADRPRAEGRPFQGPLTSHAVHLVLLYLMLLAILQVEL